MAAGLEEKRGQIKRVFDAIWNKYTLFLKKTQDAFRRNDVNSYGALAEKNPEPLPELRDMANEIIPAMEELLGPNSVLILTQKEADQLFDAHSNMVKAKRNINRALQEAI
jgi:hypothetical protein